jgi:hypothetical protein
MLSQCTYVHNASLAELIERVIKIQKRANHEQCKASADLIVYKLIEQAWYAMVRSRARHLI